jgi:hypothetical protein
VIVVREGEIGALKRLVEKKEKRKLNDAGRERPVR